MKIEDGDVIVYFKNDGTGISRLPISRDYSEKCSVLYDSKKGKCEYDLTKYKSSVWLLSVILAKPQLSAMISINCDIDSDLQKSYLFWILLSVSLFLVILGITLIVIRKIRVSQNQVIPALEPMHREPNPISQEKIQDKFPWQLYEELDAEDIDKCLICLDLFSACSKVRQLDCKHIFHQKCIDL